MGGRPSGSEDRRAECPTEERPAAAVAEARRRRHSPKGSNDERRRVSADSGGYEEGTREGGGVGTTADGTARHHDRAGAIKSQLEKATPRARPGRGGASTMSWAAATTAATQGAGTDLGRERASSRTLRRHAVVLVEVGQTRL